jgi:hypothetical protein
MIKATFRLGGEHTEAIIDGNNLMFSDTTGTITTIEGLKLSMGGVIKEFPDLENDKEWRRKALDRFKEHYKKMKGENEKLNYVKGELEKHGYIPLFKQRAGFRPQKFK